MKLRAFPAVTLGATEIRSCNLYEQCPSRSRAVNWADTFIAVEVTDLMLCSREAWLAVPDK